MDAPYPSIDLKFNGSDGPITVPVGSQIYINWTSQNTSACTMKQAGPVPLAEQSAPLTFSGPGVVLDRQYLGQTTLSIRCTGPLGRAATDSATVNVVYPH